MRLCFSHPEIPKSLGTASSMRVARAVCADVMAAAGRLMPGQKDVGSAARQEKKSRRR